MVVTDRSEGAPPVATATVADAIWSELESLKEMTEPPPQPVDWAAERSPLQPRSLAPAHAADAGAQGTGHRGTRLRRPGEAGPQHQDLALEGGHDAQAAAVAPDSAPKRPVLALGAGAALAGGEGLRDDELRAPAALEPPALELPDAPPDPAAPEPAAPEPESPSRSSRRRSPPPTPGTEPPRRCTGPSGAARSGGQPDLRGTARSGRGPASQGAGPSLGTETLGTDTEGPPGTLTVAASAEVAIAAATSVNAKSALLRFMREVLPQGLRALPARESGLYPEFPDS